MPDTTAATTTTESDGLLLAVETLAAAHDRHEAERSDTTSSGNSAGDDGENRDLNLPKAVEVMEHRLVTSIEKALGWDGPVSLGTGFVRGQLHDVDITERLM